MPTKNPLVAVYCRCGAAWYGHYAVNNEVIASHRVRCGPPVTPEDFARRGFRLTVPKWFRDRSVTQEQPRPGE